MNHADVCIVGGGLAGLSVAYFLSKLDNSLKILIFESREALGGLLRSVNIGNFIFDIGGSHILFSRNKEVLKGMTNLLNGNYVKHRRNTKIYYNGVFVKYPFEIGLKDLPPKERFECLRDLVLTYVKRVKGELKPPIDFLEWIKYMFGSSIAEKYLIPYNRKFWKVDLREISLEWVGDRIPNPPLEKVMKAAAGIDVEGYVHQLNFYYPKVGGIEALIKALISKVKSNNVKIFTNSEVNELVKSYSRVIVGYKDGEAECKSIIYTAPLNRSGNILRDFLEGLDIKLTELRSVPLAVVGIGLKDKVPPYHWIYFPSNTYIFHRVAFISNYSLSNAPEGSSSVIAEISFPPGTDVESISSKDIAHRTIEGLIQSGLIKDESRIALSRVWVWRDAYILYDLKRSIILKSVKPFLEREGVFLHGRFGGWDYLNMDAVYERSRNLALKVIRFINHGTR